MAKLEIEVDDTTGLPTSVPEGLKPWQQRQFNEGFQKGSAKKAEELTPLITSPEERQKARDLEEKNRKLEIEKAEAENNHAKAQQLREEQHQKDLADRDAGIKTRDEKLRLGVNAEIKAAALRAGARDGSLDELIAILGGEIYFDEKLDPVVRGADGKPAVDDKNQPLTIEGRVRKYLEGKPHHLNPTGGAGGGANGGASFTHLTGELRQLEERRVALEKDVQANPRDDAKILELHSVSQQIAKAKKG